MVRRTQLMDPAARELAQELTALRQDVETLKQNFRAAQLGNSTIEGGQLQITDSAGIPRGSVGMQPDGTFAQVAYSGTPPPQPNTPTVSGFPAGINIKWDGQFIGGAKPFDFSHVEVHVSTVNNFIPSAATHVGVLGQEGSIPHAPLDSGTTYYARLRAMSTSLVASTVSPQASGTPNQVVAQAVLDGIVTETKLAAQAVSEAKLKASAVTTTKIADDAISSPKIVAGGIQAVNLAAESVQASKIAAAAVTAEKIGALAITSDKIAANAITAGKIAAGSITATHLVSELVLATTLVAGNPTGARIVINTAGIEGFRSNGTRVLDFDNATGDMTIAGRYRSADTGSRVEINPNGTAPQEIRFYQGSNYGFIGAEPAVGGEAAVRGRSEVVSNRYGSFGCYPGEAYIGHFYNPTGAASTACSVIQSVFNNWGYTVNSGRVKSSTVVQSDGGPVRHSFFELNNPYEAAISATVLEFKTKTANGTEPMFVAPFRGSGMVFGVGHLYFTDGGGNGAIAVHASAFTVESGRQSKTDVKDLGFKARDKIKVAKVKKWKRPGDRGPREKVFLPVVTPLGSTAPLPPQEIDGPDLGPVPEQIGPMAEDMPPEVVVYDPQFPDRPGISLTAHISLVHAAVGDLIDEIDALTQRVTVLEAKGPK